MWRAAAESTVVPAGGSPATTSRDHEDCTILDTCEMQHVWGEAQERMVSYLESVTMADMASRDLKPAVSVPVQIQRQTD